MRSLCVYYELYGQCSYYRKKLSNFSHSNEWNKDSNNYVAKRYMSSEIERMSYYDDVKLQVFQVLNQLFQLF